MNLHTLIYLIVLIPLCTAIIIPLFKKIPNTAESISIVAGFINTILCIIVAKNIFFSAMESKITFAYINNYINFNFAVDNFGILFAILVNFLWSVTIIYATGYMRSHNEKNQTRFYSFFALAIFCTLGVAFSGNLFTLFMFYELLTLSTFPLVAHNLNDKTRKNVNTYIAVLVISSLTLFLSAIMLTFVYTGTTEFTSGGIFKNSSISGYTAILILLLFMFGIAKVAVMPLHKWLPAAMVAPTPVSALLHAVAVVKSGAFAFIKIVIMIFGIDYLSDVVKITMNGVNWLVVIPSITLIWASIMALFQDNLKRRLAYSTISQLSYIVLATVVLTPISLDGAVYHLFAHAFGKITLFFAAGSIIVLAHKENVSELGGIAKKMPITMFAFTVGAFSMIGLPFTIGFVSKVYILKGIIESKQIFPLIVIILSTILNALYFIPIIFKAYSTEIQPAVAKNIDTEDRFEDHYNKDHSGHHFGKSMPMDIAMIITSSIILLGGTASIVLEIF